MKLLRKQATILRLGEPITEQKDVSQGPGQTWSPPLHTAVCCWDGLGSQMAAATERQHELGLLDFEMYYRSLG